MSFSVNIYSDGVQQKSFWVCETIADLYKAVCIDGKDWRADNDHMQEMRKFAAQLLAEHEARQTPEVTPEVAPDSATLRDDFAKAAMQTLANGDYRSWENLADDSFRLADAMMKRRAQR